MKMKLVSVRSAFRHSLFGPATAAMPCALAALIVLAPGALLPVRADGEGDLRARAEEAFRAERTDEAIGLYRQVVEASPRDAFSLARLALVLSWQNRLDESISVYERLLAVTPEDDEARVEMAKICGWAGRYDEARAIYTDLIDRKDHALEAGVGMGDLASWEGNLPEASRWYRQVLQADEGNEKATLGLARVHHWQGLDREAMREAEKAVERFPKSREAAKLRDEIRDTLRPTVSPAFDRTLESDTNDLKATRVTASLHADPQTTVDLSLSRHEASFRCRAGATGAPDDLCPGETPGEIVSTRADSVSGLYSTRMGTWLVVDGRVGVNRLRRFDGESRTGLSGGASATVTPSDRYGFGAGVTREALTETARLIDNNVYIDAVAARGWYRFSDIYTVRGSAQRGRFSDGNDRNVFSGSIEAKLPLRHPRLTLGAAGRWVSYANGDGLPRVPVGYFSPDRIAAYVATAALSDSFLQKRFYWSADLQAGVQNISNKGVSSGSDNIFGWNLLAGWNITHDISAEAAFGRSDYAQQVSSGYNSEHYGFLVRIRL